LPARPRQTGIQAIASVQAVCSFEIFGLGIGVPPGSYKLAVYHRDKGFDSDALEGAFSEENTPIKVQVPEAKVGGRFDLEVIDLNTFSKK
jgi:hypothetical protein